MKTCDTLPVIPTVANGTVSYYLSTDDTKTNLTNKSKIQPNGVIVSKLICSSGYIAKSNNIDKQYTCQLGNYTKTQTGVLVCEMQTCNTLPNTTVSNGTVNYYLSTDGTKTNLTGSSKIQPNAIIVSKLSCSSGYIAKSTNVDKKYTCQGGSYTQTQVGSLECVLDSIPFHITVKTTSSNQSFTFKFFASAHNGSSQDCTIDWGDGSSEACPTSYGSSKTHTYATAKEYDLKVSGRTFVGIYNNGNNSSATMITKLHSYGKWENNIVNMDSAFMYAGLTYINSDVFRYLPNVTSFSGIFQGCTSLNYYIPTDLFRYNTAVTSFVCAFNGCTSLKCSYIDGGTTSTVVNHSTWPKWGHLVELI